DVRGDTGDTEVVGRRTDGGRDVRAVAVVVVVVGVDAATELARPVHHFAVRIGRHVDGEVARQVLVEVRRDVRVAAVHTGVDDADANLLVTRLYVARQVGADHGQAPQLVVHRVHGRAGAALLGGLGGLALLDLARAVLTLDLAALLGLALLLRGVAERLRLGRTEDRVVLGDRGGKAVLRGAHREQTDGLVGLDDLATRGLDSLDNLVDAGAALGEHVEFHGLAGHRRSRHRGHGHCRGSPGEGRRHRGDDQLPFSHPFLRPVWDGVNLMHEAA